jgi:hypothetical protein
MLDPDDESIRIIRNVGKYAPNVTASHPRQMNLQQRRSENIKRRNETQLFHFSQQMWQGCVLWALVTPLRL